MGDKSRAFPEKNAHSRSRGLITLHNSVFLITVVMLTVAPSTLILYRKVLAIPFKLTSRKMTVSASELKAPRTIVRKLLSREQAEGDGARVWRSIGRYGSTLDRFRSITDVAILEQWLLLHTHANRTGNLRTGWYLKPTFAFNKNEPLRSLFSNKKLEIRNQRSI